MDLLPALALQHLWNARHMAALCRNVEHDRIADGKREIDNEVRGLAMMAFISAAAFVESLINELFSQPSNGQRIAGIPPDAVRTMKVLWDEVPSFERAATLDKYQAALAAIGKPQAIKNSPTRQPVQTVLDLRNALLHYKPKWQGNTAQYMANQLSDVPRSRQLRPGAGFPNEVLNADSAEWACKVCVDFVDEWSGHMELTNPPDTQHQTGDWPTP